MKLIYVHDPMCSWCWGFESARQALEKQLPDCIERVRWVGGLAPDNDSPMTEEMQQYVQANWRRVEQAVPHIRFNYDFWEKCKPKRSTYNACRAVLVARQSSLDMDEKMTNAIQEAYYSRAMNPSEIDTLIQLGVEIGLPEAEFGAALQSKSINDQLFDELNQVREYGIQGFPTLLLEQGASRYQIPIDLNSSHSMLTAIEQFMANHS